MSDLDVRVRGTATAEEIAAVVAALHVRQQRDRDTSRFERWRRDRQRALRDNR
jgi:hypothetical protein